MIIVFGLMGVISLLLIAIGDSVLKRVIVLSSADSVTIMILSARFYVAHHGNKKIAITGCLQTHQQDMSGTHTPPHRV